MLFLANNLSLAAQIPLAVLLQWALYGQRPRWLSSVQGGFVLIAVIAMIEWWRRRSGVARHSIPAEVSHA